MNAPPRPSPRPRLVSSLLTCSVTLCVAGCGSSPRAPSPEAPTSSEAPAQRPSTPVADPAPEEVLSSAPPPTAATVPNWTVNGSSKGTMVLRCENAFPPEDGSGKCMCQNYELDICADGIRHLMIDRKQCGFVCKPAPQNAKRIALRCPDGTPPEASDAGCACGGRKPLDPCAGGLSSTKIIAGACVVTCAADQ